MDEWVDIVDKFGKLTGQVCLKSEVHEQGYWHPCVNIWLYNREGEVLIQKRVADKDTFPNLWDVSVAGHIGAGEIPIEAAQRELSEELGVKIPIEKLKEIGSYISDHSHPNDVIDREFHYVYVAELMVPIDTLDLQTEEVADIKMVAANVLTNFWSNKELNQEYVPYTTAYCEMVFQAIQNQIKSLQ
jgi:isopentenyldiphosphate isomerase